VKRAKRLKKIKIKRQMELPAVDKMKVDATIRQTQNG
jgi:hypothetical protein